MAIKARYGKNFEYGKSMAKTSLICAAVTCLVSLLFFPEGSILKVILLLVTVGLMVATVVFAYKYCRCPYCGKRIIFGVLAATHCPACRRNLTSGKKSKR